MIDLRGWKYIAFDSLAHQRLSRPGERSHSKPARSPKGVKLYVGEGSLVILEHSIHLIKDAARKYSWKPLHVMLMLMSYQE